MPKLTQTQIDDLFTMTPDKALQYLVNRGMRFYPDYSDNVLDNATGFRFANLSRTDIAQDLINGLVESIKNGETSRDYVKRLAPVLKQKGWWGASENIDVSTGEITKKQQGSSARLELIHRNSMQSAYSAGRYEMMLSNGENRPYWRYRAIRDMKTRPSHAALDGKVFHYLDPIWKIIFPPCGHNCRCSVEALTAEQVKSMGLTILSSDKIITHKVEDKTLRGIQFADESGKTIQFFPDAGFDYNPAQEVFNANMSRYSSDIASHYIKASLAGPELGAMLGSVKAGHQLGSILPCAALDANLVSKHGITSNVAFLSEANLVMQRINNSLPPKTELLFSQPVIEAPDIIIRISESLNFYKEIDNLLYKASLSNDATIIQFMRITTSELDYDKSIGAIQ